MKNGYAFANKIGEKCPTCPRKSIPDAFRK